MLTVKFAKLHENAIIPKYAKLGDAGLDLTAVSVDITPAYIEYDTGLAVEIPEGYVGLAFPRSSVSKTDLSLANCVGVVDSGYRGSICARFKRTSLSPKIYQVGERVIQLIIVPYPAINAVEVPYCELSSTERGQGGFGSSGS